MKKNIANKSAKALALGLAVTLGSSTAISGVVGGTSIVRASAVENDLDSNTPNTTNKYIEVLGSEEGNVFTFEVIAEDTTNNDDTTNSGKVKLISYGPSKGGETATGEENTPFIGTIEEGKGTSSAIAIKVANTAGSKKYHFDITEIGNGTEAIVNPETPINSTDISKFVTVNLTNVLDKAFEGVTISDGGEDLGNLDFSGATSLTSLGKNALKGAKVKDLNLSNITTYQAGAQDKELENITISGTLTLKSGAVTNLSLKGATIGTLSLVGITGTQNDMFEGSTIANLTVDENSIVAGSAAGKGATIENLNSSATTIKENGLANSVITKNAKFTGNVSISTNAFNNVTFKGATIDFSTATTALDETTFKGAKFELGEEVPLEFKLVTEDNSVNKNIIKLDKVTTLKSNTFENLDLTNVDFDTTGLAAVTEIQKDAFRSTTMPTTPLKLNGINGSQKIKNDAFSTAQGNFILDLSDATSLEKTSIQKDAFRNIMGIATVIVPTNDLSKFQEQFEGKDKVIIGDTSQAEGTAVVEEANKIKVTFSKPVKAEGLENFAEVLKLTKNGGEANLIDTTTRIPEASEGLFTTVTIDLTEEIAKGDKLTLSYKASADKKLVDNLGQEIKATIMVTNSIGQTNPKAVDYYYTTDDTSNHFVYILFDQPIDIKGDLSSNIFKLGDKTISEVPAVINENTNILKIKLNEKIDTETLEFKYKQEADKYIYLKGNPYIKVEDIALAEVKLNKKENVAPKLQDAVINEVGNEITLTFDEPIKLTSTPISVKAGEGVGAEDTVIEVSSQVAEGNKVKVTLSSKIYKGDSVLVSFTGNNITDIFENEFALTEGKRFTADNVTAERDKTVPVVNGTVVASKNKVTIPFDKPVAVKGTQNNVAGFFKITGKDEVKVINVEAKNAKDNTSGALELTLSTNVLDGDKLSVSYLNEGSVDYISNEAGFAKITSIKETPIVVQQQLTTEDIIQTKEGYKFKVVSDGDKVSTNADGSTNVALVEKVDTSIPDVMTLNNTTTVNGKNVEVKNGTFDVVGNKIVVSQIGDGTNPVKLGEGKDLTVQELQNVGALATTVGTNALKDVTVTGNENLVLKNVKNVMSNGLAISSQSSVKTVYLPKQTEIDVKNVFGDKSSVTGIVVETSATVKGTEDSKINVTKKDKAKATSAEISNSAKDTITVKFDKNINVDSLKAQDVKVNVNNSAAGVKEATVSDKTVTIKLDSAVKAKDTVNLTLNVEDADNFAVGLSSYSVRNNVTDSSSNSSGSGSSSNGGGSSSSGSGNGGSGSAIIGSTPTTEGSTGNVTEGNTEATTKELSFDTVKLPTVGESLSFTDVPTTHWANSSISKLSAMGVINGMPNGSFDANGNSKRADVAIMFTRLLGLEGASSSTFGDVPYNAYYANAVGLAKDYGIINGTGNGNFNPNGSITRQDAMVMIDRVLRNLNIPVNTDTTVLSQFGDTSNISGYALESVAVLVNSGIINGNDGKINPTSSITRAEIAAIMDRLYTIIDDASKKAQVETMTEEKSSESTSESQSLESTSEGGSSESTTEASTETTTEEK